MNRHAPLGVDDSGDPSESAASISATRAIPDVLVQKAAQLVDLMAVLDRIDAWRNEQRRGPGGRPEVFPMRALLVGMVLCVITDQPLLATRMRDVLFIQISPAMRASLGFPDPPGPLDRRGWAACYRNTRTRLHALFDVVDPSVLPKNRRLGPEAFLVAVELRRSVRSEGDLEIRRERLSWLVNQILEASFRMIHAPIGVGGKGRWPSTPPSFPLSPEQNVEHRESKRHLSGLY